MIDWCLDEVTNEVSENVKKIGRRKFPIEWRDARKIMRAVGAYFEPGKGTSHGNLICEATGKKISISPEKGGQISSNLLFQKLVSIGIAEAVVIATIFQNYR